MTVRPRTRRQALALRAQERREIAAQAAGEPPEDAEDRLHLHLREARMAALEKGRFIVAAEIEQILRLVEARPR